MSTVHNEAKVNEIAKVVLMCGDPLRAKFIADNFLSGVKLVNKVRNMLCFTGMYKNKQVSVMGSGMGMPSMGIYSYELFDYYQVDKIIRVGTCGSYKENVKVKDVILAIGASSDSNYASQFNLGGTYSATASFSLLDKANKEAKKMKLNHHVGNVLSSDIFYHADKEAYKRWAKLDILAVEMESYALYVNAALLGKKALTILTVSDNLVTNEKTTSEERQVSFKQMMELALDVAISDDYESC